MPKEKSTPIVAFKLILQYIQQCPFHSYEEKNLLSIPIRLQLATG